MYLCYVCIYIRLSGKINKGRGIANMYTFFRIAGRMTKNVFPVYICGSYIHLLLFVRGNTLRVNREPLMVVANEAATSSGHKRSQPFRKVLFVVSLSANVSLSADRSHFYF